jgi:hypothetical protein
MRFSESIQGAKRKLCGAMSISALVTALLSYDREYPLRKDGLRMNQIEVPELVGKVITGAKLLSTRNDEQEFSLTFSDGTSFAFSASAKLSAQGFLYQGGVGEPLTLREIELPR